MPISESTKNKAPRVGLICVGSELLRGKVNTHASTLARRLASIGLDLGDENSVSDELPLLTEAVRRALNRFDVVIITGGLGPTFDDLTREATAAATGKTLTLSPTLLKGIARKFKRARLRRMPPANARQAYLVQGAVAIENIAGTAPGQWIERPHPFGAESSKQIIILMPGPPSELNPMLERTVLPKLAKEFPSSPRAEAHLHFVGMTESAVDHAVRPIIERAGPSAQFTILAHLGLVDLDIFVTGRRAVDARQSVRRLAASVQKAVGKSFYGMDEQYPLERVVQNHFQSKRQTLALAESCTGGLLSSRLTEIPGSSSYFLGAVVSYHNDAKSQSLDVPAALLQRYGAVSSEVARAMAEGVRRKMGSTHGLSITGIAGPDGGTAKKPVGLLFMALATAHGTHIQQFQFSGLRSVVRQRAVLAALDLLRAI